MNSRKLNLLLINPPNMPMRELNLFLEEMSDKRGPTFETPIGLLELAAYVRQQLEINIAMLDMPIALHDIFLNRDIATRMTITEFIVEQLNKINFNPNIVGISIMYTNSHKISLEIAKIVKERWNNTVIVCGGHQATSCYNALLDNPNIDYVVRGEGEISFSEFLKEFSIDSIRKEKIDIYGIYHKQKLMRSENKNELSCIIKDLDEIPISASAYDILDHDFYRRNSNNVLKEGAIHVMWSRGCPFHCTFCASHVVHGRGMRFKTNHRIMAELDYPHL